MNGRRTLNGALAGALAAAVWAAQQPLDRRAFGVPYDDAELLGKFVTRGPAWPVIGTGLHLVNGAAFGVAYAQVGARLPGPPVARGALAGLAEHLATWPLTGLVERYHPARDDFPPLLGSGRAFAQATWRHLLFGAVLGLAEGRLNPPEPAPPAPPVASSNGHGRFEAAVGVSA